ncbi:hypothetical protein PG989_014569 [Apiospora arundinis]
MTSVHQFMATPAPPTPRPQSMTGATMATMATMSPAAEMEIDHRSASPATNGVRFGSGPQRGDTRIPVVVYGSGQEQIVSVFADVLGKPSRLAQELQHVTSADAEYVVGIPAEKAKADIAAREKTLMVIINAHCVALGMPPDPALSSQCDYEFLYTESPFFRRDLARFTSFVLGQINHHEELMAKPRTYFISTTFPDVRAALPNLDILTVGADAVEIRVDLLKEPHDDGSFSAVPSLSYVGEQVMLLRQRTELPLIFTTRCTRENGRFPMETPELYYEYLYRAIQWGVEYIDVEVWLPESIRQKLYDERGNSRIMSAFHDFSSTFKWPSAQAQSVFLESRKYADIVKMIAFISEHNENFELEYFRSRIRAEYADAPPLSMVNMGETGQLSRTLNKVFTPITHPLLPIIAAPVYMGSVPRLRVSPPPQAPFYEKCFNELGLPHAFSVVERHPKAGGIETWCDQRSFGGAYLSPPVPYASLVRNNPFFARLREGSGPLLTDAARIIGMIDTIVVRSGANSTPDSAPASTPLKSKSPWRFEPFRVSSCEFRPALQFYPHLGQRKLAWNIDLESLQRARMVGEEASPFVIVSALGPDKSNIVGMLLRVFGGSKRSPPPNTQKVFLDLADGPRKGDPGIVAEQSGFAAYGIADSAAFTTVETLRLLVGQNVPYSFVRLASGRGMF